MLNLKEVGNKISSLRIQSNLTQDNLAERIFVTRQAISRWEMGLSMPTIDNVIELSKIFEVSFEELLCLDQMDQRKYIINTHAFVNTVEQKSMSNIDTEFSKLSRDQRLEVLIYMKNRNLKINDKIEESLTDLEKSILEKEKENDKY